LRPYQAAAIAAVEAQEAAGKKRTLLVLPTGTGKTVVFAELVRRWSAAGDQTLILAHRSELLEQAAHKLAAVGVRADIDQAEKIAQRGAPAIVASVQTLRGPRLQRYEPGAFRRIVVDEAHHAAAQSYQTILDRFPEAFVLGVTATPKRLDGKALGDLFESVAFTYELRAAIRDGFLAPIRARRVTVENLNLSAIRTHHGDFDQSELSAILTAEKALHGVAAPLLTLAGTRKTLVFGVDVKHAHGLAEILNRYKPGCALALDGSAPAAERRATLALFRKGAIQILVNCALFTEGFDEPSIECVAMARPTQSWALYCQMLGRGTRLSPGKADLLVLDFVGNSGRHRLIGPADALAGGEVPAEVRDEIERELDGKQRDLEEVLAHAEAAATLHRSKAALLVVAHYRDKEVDPFVKAFMPKLDPDSPSAREPATEAQLKAMKDFGFSDPPPGFTKGEASAAIDGAVARDKAGLSSLAQIRLLRKSGLDVTNCTKKRASQLFAIAKARGWKAWALRGEPEWTGKTKW
jgi:superfamily II DNA or RNA helicase